MSLRENIGAKTTPNNLRIRRVAFTARLRGCARANRGGPPQRPLNARIVACGRRISMPLIRPEAATGADAQVPRSGRKSVASAWCASAAAAGLAYFGVTARRFLLIKRALHGCFDPAEWRMGRRAVSPACRHRFGTRPGGLEACRRDSRDRGYMNDFIPVGPARRQSLYLATPTRSYRTPQQCPTPKPWSLRALLGLVFLILT